MSPSRQRFVGRQLDGAPLIVVWDTIDDLTPLVKTRLRGIPRRPEILDGFIAETGLSLEPP
jgi:hypothetical protein